MVVIIILGKNLAEQKKMRRAEKCIAVSTVCAKSVSQQLKTTSQFAKCDTLIRGLLLYFYLLHVSDGVIVSIKSLLGEG